MRKSDLGVMLYAELTDMVQNQVRVRRCHGEPPRVVIETKVDDGLRTTRQFPPELDPAMAKQVAEALLTFCRRVAVRDDANLPKKVIEVRDDSAQAQNNRQLLSAIHA